MQPSNSPSALASCSGLLAPVLILAMVGSTAYGPAQAQGTSPITWHSGKYYGNVDSLGSPLGVGQLLYKDWYYYGVWLDGKPHPEARFHVSKGGVPKSDRLNFYYRGTLDDSIRFHGTVTTWHVSLSRIKFGEIDRAIVEPIGARSEGEWEHGVPIGTHVVRACDGCPVRRTATFKDGVFVDGDYPWSKPLLEEVEDEHQKAMDAAERER